MNQYRVKCFVFVKASNPGEAEETAAALVGATSRKDGSGVHVQTVVREGSAKLVEEKKDRKAA